MSAFAARDPKAEANAVLPTGHESRLLEPAPPFNSDPAWFADDPTDPGGAGGTVVTPIEGEGVTWAHLAETDQRIASFAHDHWLDGRRRPAPLPPGYTAARVALHQLAFFAVAAKRHAVTGKLGLRYTNGGFGTPFFEGPDGDEQVRVAGVTLIHQRGSTVATEAITTVQRATEFLGLGYQEVWFEGFHDPLAPQDPTVLLEVDPGAATAVGEWFGFATHVLERARRTEGAVDVGRVQLWPEHFDPAFEMGSADAGQRASYGASPGDGGHPEPYLYVAPWSEVDRSDPFWNAATFGGAILSYADLLASEDPYAAASEFLGQAHIRLTS